MEVQIYLLFHDVLLQLGTMSEAFATQMIGVAVSGICTSDQRDILAA